MNQPTDDQDSYHWFTHAFQNSMWDYNYYYYCNHLWGQTGLSVMLLSCDIIKEILFFDMETKSFIPVDLL